MKCAFKRVSYVGILLLLGLSIGRVCSQEGGSNNELLEEDSSGEEDGPNFASPTLTIKGTVIPREEQLEEEENILRETSEKEQREKKFSLR